MSIFALIFERIRLSLATIMKRRLILYTFIYFIQQKSYIFTPSNISYNNESIVYNERYFVNEVTKLV